MSTNGNRGRFSERLKKIAFRKRNRVNYGEDKNVKTKYNNVLKVLATIPGMVYSSVKFSDEKNENVVLNNKMKTEEKQIKTIEIGKIDVAEIKKKQVKFFSNDVIFNDNEKENTVKEEVVNVTPIINIPDSKEVNVTISSNEEINKSELKKDLEDVENKRVAFNEDKIEEEQLDIKHSEEKTEEDKQVNKNIEKDETLQTTTYGINDENKKEVVNNTKINESDTIILPSNNELDNKIEAKKLEKEIINEIKKKLVLSINELEVIQSELYILKEINGDNKTVDECQAQIDEIKKLLKKIEELKEQYDYLKDNYDFEYLEELNDDNLANKIIKLKNVFDNNQIRATVEDYKLLEEYKYLYLKIDKFEEYIEVLEDDKNNELEKLEIRDTRFEELKSSVYNVDRAKEICNDFIKEQDEILKNLDEKVSKITSYEVVDYHIKGLNNILLNSVKYMGLLMISPLKGIFPSIATETLLTANLIRGLHHGLKLEEDRRKVYEYVDYSSSINNMIVNFDEASNSIDKILSDIVKIEDTYNDQFKEYQDDFLEYKEVKVKLNDVKNKMLNNKIKIEIMKNKSLSQMKKNEKKLKLINNLKNDSQK